METKAEVNGGAPLPQRQQKNQPNKMLNKPNQQPLKTGAANNDDSGAPAEKKPRFNQNAGGGGQQGKFSGGPNNQNRGFGNRNHRPRGGVNNRGPGNFQQNNQNQQNQNQQQQNDVKPNIPAVGGNANNDIKPNIAQQQQGGAGGGGPNQHNQNFQGNQNQQNRGGRNMGGGGAGGNMQRDRSRGGAGGNAGGGGGGGGGNRMSANDRGDRGGFGGRGGGEDFFIQQRLRAIAGPTHELQPIESTEETRFSGRNRLYVGNLTNDITEEELRELFKPYGEIGEVFSNPEKNFAFLKLDYHANAEKAKRELDGKMRKNRPLRIRFAPNATILRVSNLTPFVSNELLYKSFEVFGPIERASITVDDRGKSTGEGVVEFSKKSSANACLRYCNEKCFFLTTALRPCVVEPLEVNDDTDGLPEKALNKKTQEYNHERNTGPRFAEPGSFEHEYGTRWKQLRELYKTKAEGLKRELKMEEEKLEAQMEYARYEHETELLRQELRKRESDNDRKKMEWEMREKQAEEMRVREEENMRNRQGEMQNRMMRQEEEMRRRQQENNLFMQAQQLNSLLEQTEGGFSGNASSFINNFADNNASNSPFEFRDPLKNFAGNNGGGGGGGGGNNNNGNNQDFPFEFGGNQNQGGGAGQGNQRGGNNAGNNNNPWERRRRF